MNKKINIGKTKKIYRKNIIKQRIKLAGKFTGKSGELVLNKYIDLVFNSNFYKSKRFYLNLIAAFFIFSGIVFFYDNLKSAYGSFITFAYEDSDFEYEEVSLHFENSLQKVTISNNTNTAYVPTKIYSNVKTVDKRAYILDLYFKTNDSPLYGTGELFVMACDKYGAPKDCLTVVAIARNETNLCKYHNSAQMHNCWGYGGGGTDRWTFSSFPEAIDIVTNLLVNSYGYEYMVDPSKMEKVFCGPTPECAGWGNNIKYFMAQIDMFSEANGFGKLTNLR